MSEHRMGLLIEITIGYGIHTAFGGGGTFLDPFFYIDCYLFIPLYLQWYTFPLDVHFKLLYTSRS